MKVEVYRNLRRGRGRDNCFWSVRLNRRVVNKHARTPNLVLDLVSSKINSKTLQRVKETGKKTPAVFLVGSLSNFAELPPKDAQKINFNPMYHDNFVWDGDKEIVDGPLNRVWFTKHGVFALRE